MRASKHDICSGLKAIKKIARKKLRKNELLQCVRFINAYSEIAGQFNFNYADKSIESIVKELAGRSINVINNWEPDKNKWVFYDDFCTTYVLGLQWLEAMASSGKEILYITTRDIEKENRHRSILSDISKYDNVTIVIIPQGPLFERSQRLYDALVRFNGSKIVLHKYPTHSISDYVLPILPANLEKYIINLSDQTFWIGAQYIDYCLEFRPFGASVSLQRRGLKEHQLLMVPFYPANDNNEFNGLPDECRENKIVVFSGGDYYKTLDKNRVYWKLVKRLLDSFPEIVFVFATKNIPEGDAEIHRFIVDNQFEKRFFYIAFRPDIYQVFAHCDIYMGTCPTSGSLMSQLAAINAKPILQYYESGTPDDETEQAICINDIFSISFNDESSFMEEAKHLISSQEYRAKQGKRLQSAMMQHPQFNRLAIETLTKNKTRFPITEKQIDYTSLNKRWLYLESAGYIDTINYIYSLLGAKDCFKLAPSVFFKKNFRRFLSYIK